MLYDGKTCDAEYLSRNIHMSKSHPQKNATGTVGTDI